MITAPSASSFRGTSIFSVLDLGRRRNDSLDYILSVFVHFRQADSVQVNIVVVPLDRRNLLNMPRFKQWTRVIFYIFKVTCILSITYFT